MLLTSFLSSYPAQNGSNVMCEFDVGSRGETDRAVREIVREEVRALLPSIAREVASLVEQNESGNAAGGKGEVEAEVGMLGLGLGRDFAISGGGDVRVSGRRSIELAQASTVQVLVRDRPLATFDLSPGSYDLEDIPLASGANDVVLLIEDDAGRVSRIEFTELYDSALLPVGRYDHALALGILSRFGTEEPVYVDERPLLNGFLRRGLTGGATVGANIEASSDVWRLDTEWLQATRFGPVDMFAAVNDHTARSRLRRSVGNIRDVVEKRRFMDRHSLVVVDGW